MKVMKANKLNSLPEEERVYLNVDYRNKATAQAANCCFDNELKLWWTTCDNDYIDYLVSLYGVCGRTSDDAKARLDKKLKELKQQYEKLHA